MDFLKEALQWTIDKYGCTVETSPTGISAHWAQGKRTQKYSMKSKMFLRTILVAGIVKMSCIVIQHIHICTENNAQ